LSFSYTDNDRQYRINTYIYALNSYSIFHFSNKGGIYFIKDAPDLGKIKPLIPLLNKFFMRVVRNKKFDEIIQLLVNLYIIRR